MEQIGPFLANAGFGASAVLILQKVVAHVKARRHRAKILRRFEGNLSVP